MKGTKGVSTNRLWTYPAIACGACAVLAACGGDSHGGPPDGMPTQTITVRIPFTDNIALVAFRDGPTAPWQTPVATEPGHYEIAVHGPYTVEAVCTVSSAALTSELSRTLDDPHDLDMPCTTDHAFSPVRVVTGSMKPEGLISIGDNVAVTRFDGTFKALAVDGTYDLVAHTDSQTAQNRVAFRRNVVVAGDTAVTPAIDLAVEGVETMSVTPTVTNLDAGETLGVAALLTTPTTTAVMHIGGVVLLLPAVALGPRDTQSIRASGTSRTAGFRSRSITRRYTPGNSVEFVLPPPLDVQYTTPGGQPVVTWDPLPRLGNLQLGIASELDNNASLAVEHDVYLSSSYLATTGATSAAFDTDLPGYDPTWRTDVTLPWGRGASASGTDGGDAVSWLYQEDVTP